MMFVYMIFDWSRAKFATNNVVTLLGWQNCVEKGLEAICYFLIFSVQKKINYD